MRKELQLKRGKAWLDQSLESRTHLVELVHEVFNGLLELGAVEDDGKVLDQRHVLVDHGIGVREDGLVVALGDALHFLCTVS